MPQQARASLSWLVMVITKVVHGLEQVLVYLDDVTFSDEDPASHVLNMIALFKHLRQYNLNLSPGTDRIGATSARLL